VDVALAELSNCTVLDLDGQVVAMPALWAERTRVLVWLRHYG
jgi:hypothetical protein